MTGFFQRLFSPKYRLTKLGDWEYAIEQEALFGGWKPVEDHTSIAMDGSSIRGPLVFETEDEAWDEMIMRGLVTRAEICVRARLRPRIFQIDPKVVEKIPINELAPLRQAVQSVICPFCGIHAPLAFGGTCVECEANIAGFFNPALRREHEFEKHEDSTLASCKHCGLPWGGFDPSADQGCNP